MDFKDYYQILGVQRNASPEDIKKSFRTLARKYHPDVAADKKTAESKFKEINEAYEVLGNPENRKKFDQLGANWKHAEEFKKYSSAARGSHPGGGAGSQAKNYNFEFEGTGFSDFFEQFFGGASRGGGFSFDDLHDASESGGAWKRGGTAKKGRDIEGDILISLEEVLKGSVRTITVRTVDPKSGEPIAKTYNVRIPAGVAQGQSVCVRGKGEEGSRGASAGDLYLRVRYAQHPDFQVHGSDLYSELELSPWEAVLGTTARISSLDGGISLKVQPFTQTGAQLRVRGRGLPAKGGTRGDLYVLVSVKVPSSCSEDELHLWKQLASKSSFNPRG